VLERLHPVASRDGETVGAGDGGLGHPLVNVLGGGLPRTG
jgi:hypothetical protein